MANILIQVSIDQGADFEQVAAAAERAGLRVRQKLCDIGLLIGEIDEALLSSLEAVPGVLVVERSKKIRLPNPNDPLQ